MLEPFGEAIDREALCRLGRGAFFPADRLGDLDGRDCLRVGFGQHRIGTGHLVHGQLSGISPQHPPPGDDQEEKDDHQADGDFLQDTHGTAG